MSTTPARAEAATPPGWLPSLVAGVCGLYLWMVLWLGLVLAVGVLVGGFQPLVISSGSMLPRINVGDVVLIADVAGDPPGEGSVITFRDPGMDRLVTHRIASVEEDGSYRTKGDANPDLDSSPVLPEDVLGMGRVLVPVIGLPAMWIGQGAVVPAGLWLVLTLAAIAGVSAGSGRAHDAAPPAEAATPPPADASADPWLRRNRVAVSVVLAGSLLVAATVAQPTASGAFAGTAATPSSFAAATLEAPTGVTATFRCGLLGAGRNVLVEWSAVTGADRYEVLRSTTSGSGYAVVHTATASTTSWADTDIADSTTYHYVVRAAAGTWVSAPSTEASATTQGLICA